MASLRCPLCETHPPPPPPPPCRPLRLLRASRVWWKPCAAVAARPSATTAPLTSPTCWPPVWSHACRRPGPNTSGWWESGSGVWGIVSQLGFSHSVVDLVCKQMSRLCAPEVQTGQHSSRSAPPPLPLHATGFQTGQAVPDRPLPPCMYTGAVCMTPST